MSSSNDQTGRPSGSTWRPSAQDQSSRAFTGSFTRQKATQRPTSRSKGSRPFPYLAIAAALLAAGAAIWLGFGHERPAASAESVAVIELVRGPVQLVVPAADGTSRQLDARPGLSLPAGTVIETAAGEDGGLAVRLQGGSAARFDGGSQATLKQADQIELRRGAVYVDSRPGTVDNTGDAGQAVEVRTTFGLVRDIGTQFEVRLVGGHEPASSNQDQVAGSGQAPASASGRLRVRVREGRILFTGTDGDEHRAAAGEELLVSASGTVERSEMPIYGPHWQWVLATAPVPEVEGRPLSLFLDWLEREGGWSLQYEPASRELAEETMLFGTIHGLSADEATPMVFAGSGLVYRLEGERLIISQRP